MRGLRVADLACGEGYGVRRPRRAAAEVVGVDANPEAHEHARLRYRRDNLRFARRLVEEFDEPCDAIVIPADDRAHPRRRRRCSTALRARRADRLRHDAEPADPRAAGRREVREPVAPPRVHPEPSTGSCSSRISRRWTSSGSSTPASCARTSWRCRPAGTASIRRSGSPSPFYSRFVPAIASSDFRVTVRRRPRGARSTSWRSAVPDPREQVGDLAIVLHSHMPYVEGFGTYPFGEEWLFDAVARSYLPVLAEAQGVTVTVSPVLADQLEARAAGAAGGVPARATGWRRPSATRATRRRSSRRGARPRRPGTGGALDRLAELGGDAAGGVSRRGTRARGGADPHGREPRRPPAGRHRRRAPAADRRRRCARTAPLRPRPRVLAPGVRVPRRHRAAPRRARPAVLLRRPERARAGARRRWPRSVPAAGLVAFTIDWEAVELVWSERGYPADGLYAEFHRLSMEGTRLWAVSGDAVRPAAAADRDGRPAGR